MADWKFQYPSTALSRLGSQGDAYAELFRGEANKLLYELKNLMKFRNLGQLKMTRVFTDGTIVTAWSVFGQDFVNIDASRRAITDGIGAVSPSCAITLLNFPTVVQPMKYPGEIHGGEIEGVDYIRVYYTIDLNQCEGCSEEAWNLCDENTPECDQFKFVMGGIPSIVGDPNDHCIQAPATCHAQLISHGIDALGRYLIFKVFTEWSFANPSEMIYSRNGLGHMLLKGWVEDKNGNKICEVQNTLRVDCCLKDPDLRKVILWDESDWFGGPREMIFDASGVFKKTPDVVTLAGLRAYALGSGAFWVMPDLFGGCLPFTWTLSGPGILVPSETGASASYQTPDGGFNCNDSVTITVKDRCGTEDAVTTSPCCAEASALEIGYTNLIMGCGASQYLEVIGGCPPYSWSITGGGGTLDSDLVSTTAMYTSPALNSNCSNNPTIQVSDCCGNSAQIKLALNCYSLPDPAFKYCAMVKTGVCKCSGCSPSTNACSSISFVMNYKSNEWLCDGIINVVCEYDSATLNVNTPFAPDCIEAPECNPYQMPKTCTGVDACEEYIDASADCNYVPFCTDCYGRACNTLYDIRITAMKEAGCCPINPLTGLPYD